MYWFTKPRRLSILTRAGHPPPTRQAQPGSYIISFCAGFTESPRRGLLDNWPSGIRGSRKLANLYWHILIQSPISLAACPLGARSLEFGLAAPRSPSCHAHTLPPRG